LSELNQDSLELFLQEASENLQYLREYSGLLQEPQTKPEDLEKLYIAAHTLAGTSASYGFPHFSEVSAKMAHVFHYAMNASLSPEMHGPLTEFISDAISVLEFDLLQISSNGSETVGDVAAFRQRYAFAFSAAPLTVASISTENTESPNSGETLSDPALSSSFVSRLPPETEVPAEVLEFFIPEAEEHLQAATECLLALEGKPNTDDIHRLFRSIHTVKGSAAQVGLHRLSAVAHRVEDLIGRLRDGKLQPSAEIVDLFLQSIDVLKVFLHRQWRSDAEMTKAVSPLLARLDELAPEEPAEDVAAEAHVETLDAKDSRSEGMTPESVHSSSGGQPASPQAKSVRISLERLDRMMNAVGELVINRTRMLGRLAELSKLVEVLNFSKARLTVKVSEFQEKHEFSRIRSALVPRSRLPQMDSFRGHFSSLSPVT
jgi:chemosensory pili system protein ChpA (sensor histidine kinase/response regulator)